MADLGTMLRLRDMATEGMQAIQRQLDEEYERILSTPDGHVPQGRAV